MNNMINTKNYRLVEQNTKDNSKNLIKVTQKGKPMNYALYACKQLYNKKQEVVVIQGMGQASSKVISTVEFMRKRVPELHVAYEIGSLESSRVYESLQGEHDRVTTTKNIPFLSAHVTLSSSDQVKDMVGYMKPLPEGELLQQEKFRDQIEQYEPKERPELPPQQQHQKQMRGQRPKHHYKKYKNNMHENKHYGVKGQHNNPKGYQRTKQPKMTTGDNERNNNQGNRYNNSNNRDGNRNQRGGYRGSRGYRGGRGGRGNRGYRGGRGGRGRYNRNENGN